MLYMCAGHLAVGVAVPAYVELYGVEVHGFYEVGFLSGVIGFAFKNLTRIAV